MPDLHPSPVVRFDEPVEVRPTPALGLHTAEVLAELEESGVRVRGDPGGSAAVRYE
jgi:hypothetical protein